MITAFKPGTLYKLSPKHYNFLAGDNRIFLCTKKMYCPIVDVDDAFNYTTHKVHLLIDVESGGLWESDPNKQEYEEYLQ
ncbi:MAG: hypothetical protein GY829_15865 [Gammaproteobacteria bacterium]|nr:hypothetical protein [Gammaproteobacteria bacterium]